MIKVFLAEDEIVIRNGIKNSIQWEREGYEFVGEAGDGELAWPMILKTRPDILITDIRMPFMDGLELSRLVKKELPDIKILILSGYDEFEYAKEAIKLQVAEYLLKPVSSAKLLDVLKEITASIRQEREDKKLLEQYEEDMRENREYRKAQFLTCLLTQNMSVPAALEQAKELGMDLSAVVYNMLLVKVSAGEEYAERAYADVTDFLDRQEKLYWFGRGAEEWAVLVMADDAEQLERQMEHCKEGIRRIVSAYPQEMEYFGAVGKPVYRLREIKESFQEAERIFAYRYLKKWNQIIGPAETAAESENNAELNVSSLRIEKLDRSIIENFLKTGLKSETVHFIDEYFESLGQKNIQSLLFRQYVTMDIYLAAAGMAEMLGYTSEELVSRCGDFKEMESVFSSVEETKSYLKNVVEVTIDLRETVSRRRYSSILEDAKRYIDSNFDNEDISLNMVAASVSLSPNHFSTIFSQEMGQTFVEYLTCVRMERAKEFLRGSSMKTAEIAYAVGYKDAHYFSYLFKKTQKCTPREFRNQA